MNLNLSGLGKNLERLVLGFFFLSVLWVSACSKPTPNTLIIGTISGPETDLVDEVQRIALAQYGLTVRVIEFTDYHLPNEALQEGSLDATVYEHLPFLQAASVSAGYDFEVLAKTFIYPMGIYSNKINSLSSLTAGALVALPNDPSNETRALRLLSDAHLISVPAGYNITVRDVRANPLKLQFKEMDAAQLPRILEDVDLAVINTNYAISGGLNPLRQALFLEKKQSPYANLIVIRKDTKKRRQLEEFLMAFHSPEVIEKARQLFGDAAIPAW